MLLRQVNIALVCMVLLCFTACKKESKSPTMVLQELMAASAKSPDIGTLLPYMCREDLIAYYDLTDTNNAKDSIMTKVNVANYNEILNKGIKKYAANVNKINYLSEKITGSKAIVVIQDTATNITSTIHLVLEDGTWKIYADFKNKFKPLKEN
jgi:hypothetical protein